MKENRIGKTMELIVLPPFVAAAIVEHAKRRLNSAGYLVGNLDGEQITVTDYIPYTHENTDEVKSQTYREELAERVAVKKYYTPGIALVGWYAAGVPQPGHEESFKRWCEAPGYWFARGSSQSQAVLLIATMPSENNMSLSWEAHITNNFLKEKVTVCERKTPELNVTIAAESASMNVLLTDIASKALYGGGMIHPMSCVTNLDRVAFDAETAESDSHGSGKKDSNKEGQPRPVEEALIRVQNDLHQAISHARAILASGNKKEKNEEYESIAKNYEVLLEEKNKQSSRCDFITENHNDALMMKYMAALLRRYVNEIERNSRHEVKEKQQHGGHGGHGGHSNHPRKTVSFR
uniref:JAB1/MPN/MOV34 metalloenzyme domain-containing protein n=1 Tax=Trypanosoma congolense (strain IL3000) TaxID=1068625 RepID=G0UJV1_TRYCI|nr:conserved hypothetical protein [Trypanosoma congolense IL3000]